MGAVARCVWCGEPVTGPSLWDRDTGWVWHRGPVGPDGQDCYRVWVADQETRLRRRKLMTA